MAFASVQDMGEPPVPRKDIGQRPEGAKECSHGRSAGGEADDVEPVEFMEGSTAPEGAEESSIERSLRPAGAGH